MIDHKLIRSQLDLAGKSIYVQKGSSHVDRLKALEDEIGDKINVIEVPYESEKLIQDVAKGEIDYAVCDENTGMVNSTYYSNIDIIHQSAFSRILPGE